jgi:hypothetical protein
VSINNIQSNSWANPWASQSGAAKAGGSSHRGFAPNSAGTGNVTASTAGATSSAPSNPFQALAADIQAMLIQAQSTASNPTAATQAGTSPAAGTGAGTTGATTDTTAEQRVATDLQTLMNDLQGAAGQTGQTTTPSGSTSPTQTASASATDTVGQAEHHHHHHHHDDGGEAAASSAVASATTSATPATAAAGPAAATTAASSASAAQAVSRAFAGDVVQALQAYGSGAGTPMMQPMII